MSIPIEPVPVPDVVSRIAVGRPVHPAWANEIGGVTFQIGDGTGREFVKVAPPHPEIDLHREAAKLRWAASYLTVPEVLGVGRDGPLEWLHTAGLPGRSAVDPHWIARPREAVRAIATGLRAMHDRLPVDSCPFSWSVPSRLAACPSRQARAARAALRGPAGGLPRRRLRAEHVDLRGRPVVRPCRFRRPRLADRWADLAVAEWSLGYNYGGAWRTELLRRLRRRPQTTSGSSYYLTLWNAGDISSH